MVGLKQLQGALNAAMRSLRPSTASEVVTPAALEPTTPEPATPRDAHEFVPAGHFYSVIPSLSAIRDREAVLFGEPPRSLPGIDLREDQQLALLQELQPFYAEQPFTAQRTAAHRYYFENSAYSYSDALFLHCMIRHARPKRIVEVGSGYSSCLILDTNELHFDDAIALTLIEPYPDLVRSLVRAPDLDRVRLIEDDAQRVDLRIFSELGANDILFIDSTHVAKIGSDVNYLIFEVLPRLAPGVLVHVHDIFYPFEYPKEWVYEGRCWNEAYLMRAFLQNNSAFEIVLFNTFMQHFHRDYFERNFPLCVASAGGAGSLWLRAR